MSPSRSAPSLPTSTPWRIWLALATLALAAFAAYHNTFSAPFIFDDIPGIKENATIRDLGRPSELLAPPALRGSGVAGRPMVNLSLAINHAIGGEDVTGYHVFNLLIHIGAGLALFGVVRRTLQRGNSPHAVGVGWLVALLWLVHPLQTESVTCVIQRTEGLVGLFFLTTLYCFLRSLEDGARRGWSAACVAACVLGALTKEVMAMAPILILLYDRTFGAGTFRGAWQARRGLHLTLFSTWIIVLAFIWRSGVRGGTVGFGGDVTAWEYALTQCRALMIYLKLALWPHPLVLDYGTEVIRTARQVVAQGLAVLALLGLTIWALVKHPRAGFLGAWFFVILGPSSSFIPLITQTMAEHRMYLPLAGVIMLGVVALQPWWGRRFVVAGVVVAAGLCSATIARNHQYRSAEAIWEDTVAKWPTNPRAHYTMAMLADERGDNARAIEHGKSAVGLLPKDPSAYFNLAFSYAKAGQLEDAVTKYKEAARLKPDSIDARVNMGGALARLGRLEEAAANYEGVVQAAPDSAEDWFNLGQIYLAMVRLPDAIRAYEKAAALKPELPETHYRLANARRRLGQNEAAIAAYRDALRYAPDHFEANVNLAGALQSTGRNREALPYFEKALSLRPDYPGLRAAVDVARAVAR